MPRVLWKVGRERAADLTGKSVPPDESGVAPVCQRQRPIETWRSRPAVDRSARATVEFRARQARILADVAEAAELIQPLDCRSANEDRLLRPDLPVLGGRDVAPDAATVLYAGECDWIVQTFRPALEFPENRSPAKPTSERFRQHSEFVMTAIEDPAKYDRQGHCRESRRRFRGLRRQPSRQCHRRR